MTQPSVLIVIPARGGSKGIPRKNLRALAGRPLISYAIETAKHSSFNPVVCVSSEDEEILAIARKLGAVTHQRNPEIAVDETTLDPVIHAAYAWCRQELGREFEIIATMQPTSPLLSVATLDSGLQLLLGNSDLDTVISARDDTHLAWRLEGERFVPDYKERLNRQYLAQKFRETGGLLATRYTVITPTNRIGPHVELLLLNARESIDIDSFEDWSLCEYHLKRKRMLFVVSGYPEIGLGHVYNTLLIANDILDHEIIFLVDSKSDLAYSKIAERNYTVFQQQHDDIIDDIKHLTPDIVINDRLATSTDYIEVLKELGLTVINFEDMGDGAALADLVINAIYPEEDVRENQYSGYEYFCLRDEFILTDPTPFSAEVRTVLLTFGGVDPNNYTLKVLESIYDYCEQHKILIEVIAGFGYDRYDSLSCFPNVRIFRDVNRISDHMAAADIAFTSAGRTVFEVASVGTPAIVLAQNERELTHTFASEEHGFVNLGMGTALDQHDILTAFRSLVESNATRNAMFERLSRLDLSQGRRNVILLINSVLEKHNDKPVTSVI